MTNQTTLGYDRSAQAHQRAARCIGGASLTRSKAPGRLYSLGAGPLYASVGHGALLVDVDGNQFIDMICALGAISLGYGDAGCPVDNALGSLHAGWIYSLPCREEAEAAEAVLRVMAPWASQVRFVKTGSEATHAAYRVAKAATGRPYVLMGDWAYHGWHEWSQKPVGSGGTHFYAHGMDLQDLGVPGTEIAAVFVEPHRWEPTPRQWFRDVRAFCDRVGALLVFDDMIYGLRAAIQGSAQYFDVVPDLACFGKAIGNGAPLACVVGTAALQAHGELISGTYSGDAVALTQAIDVLDIYAQQPVVETLWTLGFHLRKGLMDAVAASGWTGEAFVDGVIAPHQRLRFADETVGPRFAAAMAARGVLWHQMLCNVSYAHTPALLDQVAAAAEESLRALRP